MAVPSHFKGLHDGSGKDARKKASRAERDGKARLPTIELYMRWLMENMSELSDTSKGRKRREPWRLFSADLYVWKLYAPGSGDGDVDNNKNWDSHGVVACKSFFVFLGRKSMDVSLRLV
jgi:hypothetical protein